MASGTGSESKTESGSWAGVGVRFRVRVGRASVACDLRGRDADHAVLPMIAEPAVAYRSPPIPGVDCIQVQLMACFVLLGAGRVVNLAVPILYKRVVDRLSYATGLQHPQARHWLAALHCLQICAAASPP